MTSKGLYKICVVIGNGLVNGNKMLYTKNYSAALDSILFEKISYRSTYDYYGQNMTFYPPKFENVRRTVAAVNTS